MYPDRSLFKVDFLGEPSRNRHGTQNWKESGFLTSLQVVENQLVKDLMAW